MVEFLLIGFGVFKLCVDHAFDLRSLPKAEANTATIYQQIFPSDV